MDNLFISVLEASKATGFPIRKWIQWILRGLICSEPELNADHIKGIPYASIAPNIMIPISSLPRDYRKEYLKKVLLADCLFSVDLAGFLESNGPEAYHKLLEETNVIKEFITIQHNTYSGKTEKLRAFAVEKDTAYPPYIARRIYSCTLI